MRVAESTDFQTERLSGSSSREATQPVRIEASPGLSTHPAGRQAAPVARKPLTHVHGRPVLPPHRPLESRGSGFRVTLAAVAILVVVAPFVTTDLSRLILRGPLKSNQNAESEKPTALLVSESPSPNVAAVPAAVEAPEPEPSPIADQPAEPVRVTQPPVATQQQSTKAARGDAPASPGGNTSSVAVDRPKFQGNLSIESHIPGAQVSIDGRPVGVTPLVDLPLPAGSHVVRLELDGYARWSGVVQIVADKTVSLSLTLQPIPQTESAR
jgi:hypothetical protein